VETGGIAQQLSEHIDPVGAAKLPYNRIYNINNKNYWLNKTQGHIHF
jgi:hypothetical protein